MQKVLNALKTFFVVWIWQTFCVRWVWNGFCVNTLYKKFDKWKGWLYLSPAIILLLIFTVWPIFNTVRMAFLEDYNSLSAVGGATFDFGIGNFTKVVEYKGFITCLYSSRPT